jgi:hypothetical protein
VQAQRPDIARRKVAPPDEDGRQGMADLTRPELHEAMTGTPAKSLGKPLRDRIVQDGRILSGIEQEVPVRRETQTEARHGCRNVPSH